MTRKEKINGLYKIRQLDLVLERVSQEFILEE